MSGIDRRPVQLAERVLPRCPTCGHEVEYSHCQDWRDEALAWGLDPGRLLDALHAAMEAQLKKKHREESHMHVDPIKRAVTTTKEELHDHRVYLEVRMHLDKGYDLVMPDAPVYEPANALTVKREALRESATTKPPKPEPKRRGKRPGWKTKPHAMGRPCDCMQPCLNRVQR